jgi:hypothetical protein
MKRKKKQRKTARGIFRSLAPLLGNAGSLSDCGIKPTIAELNLYSIAPLFRLHMLQARPALGVCFLSQPYFVFSSMSSLFWILDYLLTIKSYSGLRRPLVYYKK